MIIDIKTNPAESASSIWNLVVRIILVFSCVMALTEQVALAQFTTSGTNIYNTNTGNVGIGTSSPAHKLEVVGDVNTTGYIAVDGCCSGFAVGDRTSTGLGLFYRAGGINAFWDDTAGNVIVYNSSGNVGIGTITPSAKLEVVGNLTVSGNIAAKYQDIAEWVPAKGNVAPGTVVILDSERANSVIPSGKSYDTHVAGVISPTPGLVLGESGEGKVKVATTGRVKVHVDASVAPIKIGDLLVTSDKEGTAMKSEAVNLGGIEFHRPGTLIGKALESLDVGEGDILVLLSLQ